MENLWPHAVAFYIVATLVSYIRYTVASVNPGNVYEKHIDLTRWFLIDIFVAILGMLMSMAIFSNHIFLVALYAAIYSEYKYAACMVMKKSKAYFLTLSVICTGITLYATLQFYAVYRYSDEYWTYWVIVIAMFSTTMLVINLSSPERRDKTINDLRRTYLKKDSIFYVKTKKELVIDATDSWLEDLSVEYVPTTITFTRCIGGGRLAISSPDLNSTFLLKPCIQITDRPIFIVGNMHYQLLNAGSNSKLTIKIAKLVDRHEGTITTYPATVPVTVGNILCEEVLVTRITMCDALTTAEAQRRSIRPKSDIDKVRGVAKSRRDAGEVLDGDSGFQVGNGNVQHNVFK